MPTVRFPVPLPEPLAKAVQAESIRTGLPVRTIVAAFFVECWGRWQGERMTRDHAELRQTLNLDLLDKIKP